MSASPERFAREARALLARCADPVRAVPMAAYMKQHFVYFGVATPQRRAVLRPLFAQLGPRPDSAWLMAVAQALWAEPERECQYCACDLLVRHARALDAACEPDLARLVCTKSWWDSVDALAARVYGSLVRRELAVQETVLDYATHDNLWLRRVALLYPLHYGAATNTAHLAQVLAANCDHPDFFIRKAMGWILRQYARTDPAWVRAYLAHQGAQLSALTRREASKHL